MSDLLFVYYGLFSLYLSCVSEACGIKTKYINYYTLIIHSSISGRIFFWFYSPKPRNQVRIKYIEKSSIRSRIVIV